MILPEHTEGIEVYYDGRCGMCCSFHEWIHRQPRAFSVDFIAYQSPRAEEVFPGLGELDPARLMVVRTKDGGIFRGAEAWVWSLYSCANHQDAARKLAGPCLLPMAVHACRLLAANRHSLSKFFFSRKDQQVKEALHEMNAPECKDGCCASDES